MKIFQTSWFHILFILAIIMVIFIWYKKQDLSNYYEGFVQDSPYIFKNGTSVNDNFYAEIYNKLMLSKERSSFEIDKIMRPLLSSKIVSTSGNLFRIFL